MIQRASKLRLGQIGLLPDVSAGVLSFLQNVTIGIVQKQQIDGYTQEIIISKKTMGCVQPMKESLAVRKEGERSWRWHVIYTMPEVSLKTDDVIVFFGIRYRIMEKTNWSQHGYIQYDAIEDFKPENS